MLVEDEENSLAEMLAGRVAGPFPALDLRSLAAGDGEAPRVPPQPVCCQGFVVGAYLQVPAAAPPPCHLPPGHVKFKDR